MNILRSISQKEICNRVPQVHKKVLSKFKDECNGKILEKFIGLVSELYYNKMFAANKKMKKYKKQFH